ncbi:MAG: hypothetical protein IK093_05140 [Ruminiclostridium sp.]|nr:hypothetical protein [Ruminiclostridium sp.]
MKTAKELIEKLKTDEGFSKEFGEEVIAKSSGAPVSYEMLTETAAKFGYELTKDDIDDIAAATDSELSAEELEKVAGGFSLSFIPFVSKVIEATAKIFD